MGSWEEVTEVSRPADVIQGNTAEVSEAETTCDYEFSFKLLGG